jgi:GntR family transcriptional regulator
MMSHADTMTADRAEAEETRLRLRTSAQPLYVSLAGLLRSDILAGRLSAGSQLPTIDQLSECYGVAKVTVRQALALLAAEGLIDRLQGKGTFVAGKVAKLKLVELDSSWQGFLHMLEGNTADLLTVTPVCTEIPAKPSEGKSVGSYRYMRRVHRSHGVPYSVVGLYVANRYYELAPAAFDGRMVIPELKRLSGATLQRMQQSFRIRTADLEVARLLDLPFGAPTGEVRRVITNRDNEIVYVATGQYRGDLVVFNTTLEVPKD